MNFRELKNLGETVDCEIKALEKKWESPHLFIGGHGGNVENASPYLERFLSNLKEVQDELIDNRETRTKYITSTDGFIAGVESFYEDLRQQCDDIECMLSDYGYNPLPNDTECQPTDESETESSILTASQMDRSQSPYSDFRDKSETDSFSTPTINAVPPKSIATPVITSLASVTKLK